MKCFERIIMSHIQTFIPDTLDPLQFAYRPKRSTEDTVSTIHAVLTHLENKSSCARLLFINYSSAFNSVTPAKLTNKVSSLGVPSTLCMIVDTWRKTGLHVPLLIGETEVKRVQRFWASKSLRTSPGLITSQTWWGKPESICTS